MNRFILWTAMILVAGLFMSGQVLAAGMTEEKHTGYTESKGLGDQLDRNQVRQLQSLLEERGFEVGEVDGIIGVNTRMAISDFQREEGLPRTGDVTEETLRALATTPEQQEYFGLSPEFGEDEPFDAEEPMEKREIDRY